MILNKVKESSLGYDLKNGTEEHVDGFTKATSSENRLRMELLAGRFL